MTLTAEELKLRAYALEQAALIRSLDPTGYVRITVSAAVFVVPKSAVKSSLHCRIRAILLAEADELERYALTGTK